MNFKHICKSIRRRLLRIRYKPIRVFCLHHVSKTFDKNSMYLCDWMSFDEFKQKINNLRLQGYQFISLKDAYRHLKNDVYRKKKYAVITFDDGFKSQLQVLPWLEKQQIPCVLFVNGRNLDGISYRINPNESFITYNELYSLNSSLIEIAHHGWEHNDICTMTKNEMYESLSKNKIILSSHQRYIPFWAYTYGSYKRTSDLDLLDTGIIPVHLSGRDNYNWIGFIDREFL